MGRKVPNDIHVMLKQAEVDARGIVIVELTERTLLQ